MTSGLDFASAVAVYAAGVTMWDAWEKYQEEKTWLNLANFAAKVLLFVVAVDRAAPSLRPTIAAVLVPAARALAANIQQLKIAFPRLR
jgi:hypothetical protein